MPHPEEALTRTAYDTVAAAYARRIVGTEPEQAIDLAVIDHFVGLLPEPRRVLDAGCGAGRMVPRLAAHGCRVEGIDLSPGMVEQARLAHPGVVVDVGTLTAIPRRDACVDGVFSWYSTIHNPDDDLGAMVAEMSRVLVPGGVLLLAFQTGHGMRRVGEGFRAMGLDVVMHRYHRPVQQVVDCLDRNGFTTLVRLERAPAGGEVDGQGFVAARRGA